MDPKEVMRNAAKLDSKAMESRHHIGAIQVKKKTVTVVTKPRSSNPGAKKWDRQ